MFQDRVIAVLPHDFISWKGTQVGNSPQNLQLLHNERELWEGQTVNGSSCKHDALECLRYSAKIVKMMNTV